MIASLLTSACLTLGSCMLEDRLEFRVFSAHAMRIEVCLFSKPLGQTAQGCHELNKGKDDVWSVALPKTVARAGGETVYYGFRAWGPNWFYDKSWKPGSALGFQSDVDRLGNRFNPNKLLIDPYAREISHGFDVVPDQEVFNSGSRSRLLDTSSIVPKAILHAGFPHRSQDVMDFKGRPQHSLRNDVVYEVHLKGFTKTDPTIPEAYRGTYKGAGLKASYLKDLGVTAVEFLPVHAKVSPMVNTNYWGYMTLGFFAPEPTYAYDRSPGGPTREFREMVRQFHAAGIKVFIDVVYNHTGEGGVDQRDPNISSIWSFRGLDNLTYYETAPDPRYYIDNTGTGNNFAAFRPAPRELILDSLKYWKDILGVDGFRFDLASVLGNSPQATHFWFDPLDSKGVLQRVVKELPVRSDRGGPGVDLLAEPWAIGSGTYQQGRFPLGWAEWNGEAYRDPLRAFFNLRGVEPISLGRVAHAVAGSESLFSGNGRKPFHSINFITAHDGFTLRDLFSYNIKQNNQAFPWGPSDGGSDSNRSWDQGGDPVVQKQMARNALMMLFTSAGTPMLLGGDELYRTQRGNNNPWNLDTEAGYLPWEQLRTEANFFAYARHLIRFRHLHPELAPFEFYRGQDGDRNGLKDITWLGREGRELTMAEMKSDAPFLSWRIDSEEGRKRLKSTVRTTSSYPARSIYVAVNAGFFPVDVELPTPAKGHRWFRVSDTASWMEPSQNHHPIGQEDLVGTSYRMHERSSLLLIEKPLGK